MPQVTVDKTFAKWLLGLSCTLSYKIKVIAAGQTNALLIVSFLYRWKIHKAEGERCNNDGYREQIDGTPILGDVCVGHEV